jgi:hypothetical protein
VANDPVEEDDEVEKGGAAGGCEVGDSLTFSALGFTPHGVFAQPVSVLDLDMF